MCSTWSFLFWWEHIWKQKWLPCWVNGTCPSAFRKHPCVHLPLALQQGHCRCKWSPRRILLRTAETTSLCMRTNKELCARVSPHLTLHIMGKIVRAAKAIWITTFKIMDTEFLYFSCSKQTRFYYHRPCFFVSQYFLFSISPDFILALMSLLYKVLL